MIMSNEILWRMDLNETILNNLVIAAGVITLD